MERRTHQQTVEGERPAHHRLHAQPRDPGAVRLSLVIGIIILGVLIVGGAILGIMSLADAIRGHPGQSWQHLISWWEAIRWWLLAAVLGIIALNVLKERSYTAVDRAEARRIREDARRIHEETKHLRDTRYHNEDHMPDGYIPLPDGMGNYPQVILPDGRVISLLPGNALNGNAGINSKHLMDFMERQNNVIESDDFLQIEGPEQVDPRTVEAATLEQDLQDGYLQAGVAARLGYRIVIDEFSGSAHLEPIDDPDDTSMFICAGSTAGKSTLVSSLMARIVLRGDTVFVVIDPHKNNPDRSITAKILPALESWLAYPVVWGKDAKEVKGVVKYLRDLIALRQGPDTRAKERHPLNGLKVCVIIDEALALAAMTRKPEHDACYDDLLYLMQEMATETAKDGIIYIAMAQIATKAQMGDVDIRDVCPKSIILKTPKQSGLALNLPAELANMAHYFRRGRGFYIGDADEPELFIWGYADAETIAKVAALAVSPLRKQPENRLRILPSPPKLDDGENGFEDSESGLKAGESGSRKWVPSALRAELDKIEGWEGKLRQLERLIGADQATIFKDIWDCTPGSGKDYKEAKEEYRMLSEVIRMRLMREA